MSSSLLHPHQPSAAGHKTFASAETFRNDAKIAIERIASGALIRFPKKLLNSAMSVAQDGCHFFSRDRWHDLFRSIIAPKILGSDAQSGTARSSNSQLRKKFLFGIHPIRR